MFVYISFSLFVCLYLSSFVYLLIYKDYPSVSLCPFPCVYLATDLRARVCAKERERVKKEKKGMRKEENTEGERAKEEGRLEGGGETGR